MDKNGVQGVSVGRAGSLPRSSYPSKFVSIKDAKRRSGKVAQRQVLYLGEINDSQQAAWRRTLEVFDEEQHRFTPLSLFPGDRPVPAGAIDSVQVELSEMKLERARPSGNCWLGCELWRQLQPDQFWSGKMPQGREGVAWLRVLQRVSSASALVRSQRHGRLVGFGGSGKGPVVPVSGPLERPLRSVSGPAQRSRLL
jgi:hypothetical protein